MSILIAGFGDLGQQIYRQWRLESHGLSGPVLALRRHHVQASTVDTGLVRTTADLCKPQSLTQLPDDITHVVYCAGSPQSDEQSYRDTYVTGLANLIRHLSQQTNPPRLVFVSSTSVYGKGLDGWVDENTATEPTGFNGRIMLEAEQLVTEQCSSSAILRLSGIYGSARHHLLNRLVRGTVTIPDTPGYWANRIHIEDAARACLHFLSHEELTGPYIVSDSTPLDIRDLYRWLAKEIGAPEPNSAPPTLSLGRKRLSNKKLIATGFELRWPDSRAGYAEIIEEYLAGKKQA